MVCLRLACLAALVAILTAIPQMLAALGDGPISEEQKTVRSMKRLFFLDRTASSRFLLATPKNVGQLLQTRARTAVRRLRAEPRSRHLDERAPLPRLAWLMRMTKVNLLHHSNFT